MSFENLSSFAATIGFGGISGFFIGYFIRRLIKILCFVFGGILVLLIYLQNQGIITIHMSKVESFATGIVNGLSNVTASGQIPFLLVDNNAVISIDNLGI